MCLPVEIRCRSALDVTGRIAPRHLSPCVGLHGSLCPPEVVAEGSRFCQSSQSTECAPARPCKRFFRLCRIRRLTGQGLADNNYFFTTTLPNGAKLVPLLVRERERDDRPHRGGELARREDTFADDAVARREELAVDALLLGDLELRLPP